MRQLQPLGPVGHFYECPRWHEERWWLSDFYGHVVLTVGQDGTSAVVAEVDARPGGLGWLPDGSLLIVAMTSRKLLRLADGRLEEYADLSGVFTGHANDMCVDGRGNAYVGNFGFDLTDPSAKTTPTVLALVKADRSVHIVADGLRFPNACVITPDGRELIVNETLAARHTAFALAPDGTLPERRTWAQVAAPPQDLDNAFADLTYAPDGGCIDAAGRIWAADALSGNVRLVDQDKGVLETIEVPDGLNAYACALGGDDGRTLLITAAPDFNPVARTAASESILFTTPVEVAAGA